MMLLGLAGWWSAARAPAAPRLGTGGVRPRAGRAVPGYLQDTRLPREVRSRLRGQRDRRRCRPAIPGVADRYHVTGLFGQGQLLQLNVAGRRLTVNLGDH